MDEAVIDMHKGRRSHRVSMLAQACTGVSYADMFTECNNWPHGSHHGLADLETIGHDLDVLSPSIKNVLAKNWILMGTVGPACPN